MDVDIAVQLNFQQTNQQLHFDSTANNNLMVNVGVDPAVAFQLQREAEEARPQTAAFAAAAEREVTAAQRQNTEAMQMAESVYA